MADSPRGPGWWRATDGKFYPPHLHPYWRTSRPRPPDGGTATSRSRPPAPVGPPPPWWRLHPVLVTLAAVVIASAVSVGVTLRVTDDDEATDSADDDIRSDDYPTTPTPASTTTTTTTAPPRPVPTLPPDHPAASAIRVLSGLVADPDPTRPDFALDAFLVVDPDGDCVNSFHEALARESVGDPVRSADGCSVLTGTWYDAFTDQWTDDPAALRLDHVVDLLDAWASGAWMWSDAQRQSWATTPAYLNLITIAEEERKAGSGPADYTPTNDAQRCAYLVQYAYAKGLSMLTITEADYLALVEGLANCSSIEPASPTSPPP